jgi:DNA-binding HxlR family transcriptional regulator
MHSPDQASHTTCAASLKLLGDYWTLRIIEALKSDGLRFCALQRQVDNVNPVTLTTKLKKLEEAGLVTKIFTNDASAAPEYALTPLGKETLPVIWAVERFSERAAAVPVSPQPEAAK